MTLAIFLAIAGLVLAALVRKPQSIMVVMACAFIASVVASQNLPRETLRPMLVAIDASVVALMVPIWTHFRSQRARWVGSVGLCQVGWAILAGGAVAPWNVWAAAENASFVVQVLIAGGYADGVGAWLDHHWLGLRDRLGLVPHHVGR